MTFTSSVQDYAACPQCGFPEADVLFYCHTGEEFTRCRRCGYSGSWEAKRDSDGEIVGLEQTVTEGVGSLVYRSSNSGVFCHHCLQSEDDYTEAHEWLQQASSDGTIDRKTAYLTRWCPDTKQVEMAIGTFFDCSRGQDDEANARENHPDSEVPGPDDMPF